MRLDELLTTEPGWLGMFTRAQADGAIANGARIVKARMEPGDTTPLMSTGTVLGSIGSVPLPVRYFYFVEWDARPRVAVGVADYKIAEAPAT